MHRISTAVLIGVAVALACASPASAKISAMSGAYDGRGKPPETLKVLPSKPKKRPRKDTSAGGN